MAWVDVEETTPTKGKWVDAEPPSGTMNKAKTLLKDMVKPYVGVAEGALTTLTGMGAMPIAGLGGLAKLITSGPDEATKTIEEMSNAMTYKPQTESGQRVAGAVGQAMDTFIGKPAAQLGEWEKKLSKPFIGETGSDIMAALVDSAAQLGIGALFGGPKAGKVPKNVKAYVDGLSVPEKVQLRRNLSTMSPEDLALLKQSEGYKAQTVDPTVMANLEKGEKAGAKEIYRKKNVEPLQEATQGKWVDAPEIPESKILIRDEKLPSTEMLDEGQVTLQGDRGPIPETPYVTAEAFDRVKPEEKPTPVSVEEAKPMTGTRWDEISHLTPDEKLSWLSDEATKHTSGRGLAESLGETKGDFTGNWKELGITSARDFWKQNHSLRRKMVFDDIKANDPDFIMEDTPVRLAKTSEKDIIGLKEDLYEQGYTREEVARIVDEATKGIENEYSGKTSEELRKELSKVVDEEGQLFSDKGLFTLSGNQPYTKKSFTPPEQKGGRMFDVEKSSVDDLYNRKVTSGSMPTPNPESGAIQIPSGLPGKLKNTWNHIREFWSPTTTVPHNEAYLSARYKALGDLDRVEGIVKKTFDKTKDLAPQDKANVFLAVEGKYPIDQLPPELQNMAKSMRQQNRLIGQMLVKREMLDPATVANIEAEGGYVKYLYLKHVLGEEGFKGNAGGKMGLQELKQRKDLTREQQRAIGLIEDISVAQPVGVAQGLSDAVKNDFYKKVADNPEWTWQPGRVTDIEGKTWSIGELQKELDIQRKMSEQAPNVPEIQQRLNTLEQAMSDAKQQSGNVPSEFTKMPDSPGYGPLAGQYVRKPIAADLKPLADGLASQENLAKTFNAFLKLESTAMAGFKVGKTALNIPTMARNVVSNVIQLNMSGMNIPTITLRMGEALKEMSSNGKLYVQARRNGLFKTNWGQSEIAEVLGTVDAMKKSPLGLWEKVGDLAKYYGKIDDVFKLTKFIDEVKSGKDLSTATLEAQKWGMDYSLASRSIKYARKYVMPFVSYQYKIAPLIAESLAKRPWVIGKYAIVPTAMGEMARQTLKLSDEDWKKLKASLPLFIKQNNTFAMVPWKSPEGNAQWVNLEYFFPWQGMLAIGRDVKQGNYGELPGDFGIGNPLLDIYTISKTMRGDSPPKDPFTGRDVYNRLDTPTTKAVKTAEWVYNKWAPSMLTREGALGITQRYASGEKDKYGRKVTGPQAAGRWLGVNIIAPTPLQIAKERKFKESELKTSLMKIVKDPTVKLGEKERAMGEYRKQLGELRKLGAE